MPLLSQVAFLLGHQQHALSLSAKDVIHTLVPYTSYGVTESLRAENVDPADSTPKATLSGPRLKLGIPALPFS